MCFPDRYGGHMVSYVRQINGKVAAQCNCPFMLHDLKGRFISMAAKLGIQHHLTKRNYSITLATRTTPMNTSSFHRHPRSNGADHRRFLELMGADTLSTGASILAIGRIIDQSHLRKCWRRIWQPSL